MASKVAARLLKRFSPFMPVVTGYTGYSLALGGCNRSEAAICNRLPMQEVPAVTAVTDVTDVFQVKRESRSGALSQSVTAPVTANAEPVTADVLPVHSGEKHLRQPRKLAPKLGPEPSPPSRYGSKGGAIPAPYGEAWERLQSRSPKWASPEDWRQALEDAAAIFATWGELAIEFQWPAEVILGRAGLAWFTAGEAVRAFGPAHAVTVSGRVFDRCPPNPSN